jgi:ankyrin repeat protein
MKRAIIATGLFLVVTFAYAKDRPPLHVAAMEKDAELVESLINSGANVYEKDDLGWTHLHMVFATQSSFDKSEIFINTVRVLLSHNADINAKTNDVTTVLMLAAGKFTGRPEIVQFLLQYKPDVNAVDVNHKTALILAAANTRHSEVISLLLNAGANAKLEDNTGRTALDWFDQNKRISNNPVRKELKDRT